MSHELRTPLNAIIGFAELLHRELLITSRQPKHDRYSRVIHESGEHLLGIVNDLLDVSKMEAGQFRIVPEPFDLRTLTTGAVETLLPAAMAKGVDLQVEIARDLPEVNADRRALKQILLNLVSNACKFSNPDGRVHVRVRPTGDCVEVSVADEGIGIPEPALARLGSPFFQAEHTYARNFEGTGLGLSIVRGLVQLHAGELTIESAVGEGTTVTVLIPLDCERAGVAGDGPKRPVLKVVPRRPSVRIAERIVLPVAAELPRPSSAVEPASATPDDALATTAA
jgi:cell cycle sensor histidine kinase DivJ